MSYVLSCHKKAYFVERLRCCSNFILATSTHGCVLKSGFLSDVFTANHLVTCYVKLQKIGHARKVFDEMPEPNVVSWTSLIAGYVDTGQPNIALWLYKRMRDSSAMPNEFTYATVINACSGLADHETGKKVHAHVEILGLQLNLVVCSSLVDMYGKCNDVDYGKRVFDLMGYNKNVVTWTSMISAYAQNARGNEALQVFKEFNYLVPERPNPFMMASVINVCASLGRLSLGKVAHGAVIRGCGLNDVVATALVDMYAKCGCFGYSNEVFRKFPNPSVFMYTSMIVGAAKFGHGGELPLKLFGDMIDRGLKPTAITLIGVLHTCSHAGLVDEGLEYLNSMYEKHGIMPDERHYTCVVDMLGRVGRLDEAYKLALSIKVSRSDQVAALWGTLLSASRQLGRVDLAVVASNRMIESQQQVANAYVTLSNTYALAGDWEKCNGIRSELKRSGVHKQRGCSWVEIKDSAYVFYAGDLSCERGSEILSFLKDLERQMKERGYVGGSKGLVFVDVEEEAKEEIVGLHSERLALAFALLSMPQGITIRVTKNLRMCRDCHNAFKLISEIVGRDFVVRDINRFHHFKNGVCTCSDFW